MALFLVACAVIHAEQTPRPYTIVNYVNDRFHDIGNELSILENHNAIDERYWYVRGQYSILYDMKILIENQ
jgi:hypothetical protein